MSDETNYSPGEAPLRDQDETGSLTGIPRTRQRTPANNLPLELTSFIGREREVAQVGKLLGGRARLVTLGGPGGCGKTRLALAVAQDLIEEFEVGVGDRS
jgi:DNA polymerase III delta prime subunit